MNSRTSLCISGIYELHDFMYFFSNYGKIVSNSGFEEILYQAKMCCGWNKTSLIRELFTTCAGEFMK